MSTITSKVKNEKPFCINAFTRPLTMLNTNKTIYSVPSLLPSATLLASQKYHPVKSEVRAQSNTIADSGIFGGEMLENIRVDS